MPDHCQTMKNIFNLNNFLKINFFKNISLTKNILRRNKGSLN